MELFKQCAQAILCCLRACQNLDMTSGQPLAASRTGNWQSFDLLLWNALHNGQCQHYISVFAHVAYLNMLQKVLVSAAKRLDVAERL